MFELWVHSKPWGPHVFGNRYFPLIYGRMNECMGGRVEFAENKLQADKLFQ